LAFPDSIRGMELTCSGTADDVDVGLTAADACIASTANETSAEAVFTAPRASPLTLRSGSSFAGTDTAPETVALAVNRPPPFPPFPVHKSANVDVQGDEKFE
jgi:hypothetical protein